MEKIDSELSQYSSTLLALKSWGTIAVEKSHDLKVQTVTNILALIKTEGYVKLAKDQILPNQWKFAGNKYGDSFNSGYKQGQQDMSEDNGKTVWRKVLLP